MTFPKIPARHSLNEDAKLKASDAAAFDSFGVSVSISGDTAIVGASGNPVPGSSSGSAYIFAGTSDSIPPELEIPPNKTAECTAPEGTSVDIGQATATDNEDPNPSVISLDLDSFRV